MPLYIQQALQTVTFRESSKKKNDSFPLAAADLWDGYQK